jgi:hypothetical protein
MNGERCRVQVVRTALLLAVIVACLGDFHWPWETNWNVLTVGSASSSASCTNVIIVHDTIKKDTVVINVDDGNVPLEGAKLTGDFGGFGKRSIHNESDNTDFSANVLYHAVTYSGAVNKMVSVTKCSRESAQIQRPTVVSTFVPRIPSGSPLSGSCPGTSIASERVDAYRCFVGSIIYDPCFATREPRILECDADPQQRTIGFAVQSIEPLEVHRSNDSQRPWIIELANGTVCHVEGGGTRLSIFDVPEYYCESPKSDSRTLFMVGDIARVHGGV